MFDMREVRSIMDVRSDPDPLKTVLYQECDRYNALLSTLHRALRDLELAAQGLVVVTPELEVRLRVACCREVVVCVTS